MRLVAADERVDRALANAVERHTTKDPGMRGTLKGASVFCHPESEPAVTCGSSSASQNTGTGDVTRDVGTGPTQDVTPTSSNGDIGDDVVMREDKADENRAEHPSSSGQTAEEGSQRRGDHVKSEMSTRASLNTFREGSR